jgi:hypothetical protein
MKCIYGYLFICILLTAAIPLFAGSEGQAENIIAHIEQLYDESIDSELVQSTIRDALNHGLTEESIIAFFTAASQSDMAMDDVVSCLEYLTLTKTEGFPYNLVMNIMLEGLAKGAAGDEIYASLKANRENMEFCYKVASVHKGRGRSSTDDVALLTTILYNVLEMGFNRDEVQQLSTSVIEQKRSSAYFINSLEVLMELHSLGLEKDQTVSLIDSAISSEYRISYIRTFPEVFEERMRDGISSDDIFAALHKDLESRKTTTSKSETGSAQSGAGTSSDGSGSERGSPSPGGTSSTGSQRGTGNGKK